MKRISYISVVCHFSCRLYCISKLYCCKMALQLT